jgi:hypothetical protein
MHEFWGEVCLTIQPATHNYTEQEDTEGGAKRGVEGSPREGVEGGAEGKEGAAQAGKRQTAAHSLSVCLSRIILTQRQQRCRARGRKL